MTTYIVRRLLLAVPTLIGISFLVFMLVALSPGGVGAAVRQTEGLVEPTQRVLQQAYLEDRYGLDESVVVQYFRWLRRISPIKFGHRDQIDTDGSLVRRPRALAPPPLAGLWYRIESAPAAAEALARVNGDSGEALQARYRHAANEHARERAAYIASRAALEQALRGFATENDLPRLVRRDGRVIASRFEELPAPERRSGFAAVTRAGMDSLSRYEQMQAARRVLDSILESGPFPRAGFWIIPGVVSVAAPDFGQSFSHGRPVISLIGEALPVTLLLNLLAFPIIYAVAIPTGVLAAVRKGTWIDTVTGALFVALWSIPVVWAGVLALGFLASEEWLGLFPVSGLHDKDAPAMLFLPSADNGMGFQRGYLLDLLWHLCLPVACLVYGGFAVLSKQTRAAVLENLMADYARTARAKGLSERDVVIRHVLRNSLLPLITIFAALFPALLSGSVVVERIFSVPGMGSLLMESIVLRDRELLLAIGLMIGAVNIFALLLADILYAAADPRISFD